MARLEAEDELERRLCAQVRGVRHLRSTLVQASLDVDLSPLTLIEERLEAALSLLRQNDRSLYAH
jgi:hypothetical protein